MKVIRLMKIVKSHLTLYLVVFVMIQICGMPGVVVTAPWFGSFFWLWDTRYISPTTRNIILLVMAVILFPLVSIFYELEMRKVKRKKQNDISKHKGHDGSAG